MQIDEEAAQMLDYLYRYIEHVRAQQGGGTTLVVTRTQLRCYARSWLVLLAQDANGACSPGERDRDV